jgi:hypothetical protein
MEDWEFT